MRNANKMQVVCTHTHTLSTTVTITASGDTTTTNSGVGGDSGRFGRGTRGEGR